MNKIYEILLYQINYISLPELFRAFICNHYKLQITVK